MKSEEQQHGVGILQQKIFITAVVALWSFSAWAQTSAEDENHLQDIIENQARHNETERFDYDGGIDDLENFSTHPINLNKATESELGDLGLLSPQQIAELLAYVHRCGKLISLFELQAVPGIDLITIDRILPYVTINGGAPMDKTAVKNLFTKGRVIFLSRYRQVIEKSAGYKRTDGSGYVGSPFGLYVRFRYNYGVKLSYGFTAEKDPGEDFFSGSNKQGFDFYSGHFFLRNIKTLRALALGDYEVRLGQGLILWSGFGYGKGPDVLNVKKEGTKLYPYTSANEFNFMRGGAFTVEHKGFELTAFTSFKQVDAAIVAATATDTLLNIEEAFSSFNEAGYHRTALELAKRNTVQHLLSGGNFSYNKRTWHVGANVVYAHFFKDYRRKLYPYNQFDWNKRWLFNASIDYHLILRNFHFFGEEAISDNLGYSLLNGVLISTDARIDIALVHRYYARNFQTIYASAFAESSRPQNEHGIYLAIVVRPHNAVRIDTYFDLYKSKWLRYLTDAPSWGSDNYAQLTFTPNRTFEAYLRYRFEWKKKNQTANNTPIDYLADDKRQSLRFSVSYRVSPALTLSNRIEWSHYRNGSLRPENGFLIYQDVNFKLPDFPLSFGTRIAVFKTDSYNARFYAYERDVLYSFSIPAYSGNGIRWYLTLHYAATRNVSLWLCVAQTALFDTPTIGSGLDKIDQNHKTEIKAQLRLKF